MHNNNIYALTQGTGNGQGSLYFQYDGENFSQIKLEEKISDLAKRFDTLSLSAQKKIITGKQVVITHSPSFDVFFVEIQHSAKDFIGRSVPIIFLMRKHESADYKNIFSAFESALPGRLIRIENKEVFFLKLKTKILDFDFLVGFISWLENKVL